MIKYVVFLIGIIPLAGNSQSFLGETQRKIFKLSEDLFEGTKTYQKLDESFSFLKILNEYETLYYFFEDGICVEFMVSKPYSCECLDQDIEAYNTACIPVEEGKWMSKDRTRLYQMTLNKDEYTVSIVPLDTQQEYKLYSRLTYE